MLFLLLWVFNTVHSDLTNNVAVVEGRSRSLGTFIDKRTLLTCAHGVENFEKVSIVFQGCTYCGLALRHPSFVWVKEPNQKVHIMHCDIAYVRLASEAVGAVPLKLSYLTDLEGKSYESIRFPLCLENIYSNRVIGSCYLFDKDLYFFSKAPAAAKNIGFIGDSGAPIVLKDNLFVGMVGLYGADGDGTMYNFFQSLAPYQEWLESHNLLAK